ncbi:Nuclear envelope morphology protein 1 [Orbilia ellipsospora]|uniref:Nuclear envelope morphology protein 1 n=1 Tax=Orbilia ellipsospora TaxID=2528407 RepID=A0AAV9X379_9PEZI
MNSLSILSSQVDRVIGNTPPSTPRSEASFKSEFFPPLDKSDRSDGRFGDSSDARDKHPQDAETSALLPKPADDDDGAYDDDDTNDSSITDSISTPAKRLWRTIRASITWVVSCFYDSNHQFSFLAPIQRVTFFLIRPFSTRKYELSSLQDSRQRQSNRGSSESSEPDASSSLLDEKADTSMLVPPADEIAPRRSIRIRLFSSDKQQKAKSIKSPTSPSASLRLTRYPRLSGPPRPLLPKNSPQKTLILDLDETLIHSMSKGGSMSAAHMVEVKLDKQHAILYYVHKRPFCDEFLKKVCKWYNVVIFTASVQEYADPVIDWLDQEHKYFRARYYRQHCTFRDGVYIKDLSVVEPDLSKVMIVDNSPTSYIFHKDNAIPIEGWISDPSDHHLLHLIPILQGLQYVTDVRAFLALRMGEAAT